MNGMFINQLRENCILNYYQSERAYNGYYFKSSLQIKKLRELNRYSGTVTNGMRKRISKAVDLLLQLSPERKIFNPISNSTHKFRLAFITLTLPPQENTPTVKELNSTILARFLDWLRKYHGVKLYVWKAELQQNGTPHYHITINQFIRHDHIKAKWNQLLKDEGLLDNFYAKHKHHHPNSTDIHAVKKVKDLAGYLIKYLAKKGSKEEKTIGKLWGASQVLTKAKYYSFEESGRMFAKIKRYLAEGKLEEVNLDFITIWKFNGVKLIELLEPNVYKSYVEYKQNILLEPT